MRIYRVQAFEPHNTEIEIFTTEAEAVKAADSFASFGGYYSITLDFADPIVGSPVIWQDLPMGDKVALLLNQTEIKRDQIWRHQKSGIDYVIDAVADYMDDSELLTNRRNYSQPWFYTMEDDVDRDVRMVIDLRSFKYFYSRSSVSEVPTNKRVRRVFYSGLGENYLVAWAGTEESFRGLDENGEPRFVLVESNEQL